MKTKDSIVIGLIVVVSFMIGLKTPDYLQPAPIPDTGGLDVIYLYPERCIDCEKHIPPTCEGCNAYYRDPEVLEALGDDLGVTLMPYISDNVKEPNIFVTHENKASLGSAKNKLGMATFLCSTKKVEKSCNLVKSTLSDVNGCISKYGITRDTVLYHHGTVCEECEHTNPFVRELENLTYDDERGYNVLWIDDGNPEQMKILKECASGYMNLDYVPQVFCPANTHSKTGRMTLSVLRDFADDCIDASL